MSHKGYKCRTLVAVTRTIHIGVPYPDNYDMKCDTGPVTCCLSRKQGTQRRQRGLRHRFQRIPTEAIRNSDGGKFPANSHLPNFSRTMELNISQIVWWRYKLNIMKGNNIDSSVKLCRNIKLEVKNIFLTCFSRSVFLTGDRQTDTPAIHELMPPPLSCTHNCLLSSVSFPVCN